jgi:meso-butanediol dehydrogenase/(S,S)-butanediol dehydrogenase/diacetyl reductase
MSSEQAVALVTGAASGIGRAVALLFAERGYLVSAADRDATGLEELRRAAPSADALHTTAVDVTDADAVEAWMATAAAELGRLDVLVAAAAIGGGGRIHESRAADWNAIVAVTMEGTANCCRSAIPYLAAAGGGAIVTFGSVIGRGAMPGSAAYGAAKAGVEGMTRGLALDHAGDGVRVNCVLPGSTDTPMMWLGLDQAEIEQLTAACKEDIPLGRIADPMEIAKVVFFLASSEASFITGASVVADGGVLAKLAQR